MEIEVNLSGSDPLLEDLERDLAQIEQHIADLSGRRSELSIQLSQATRERDVLLRRLGSLRRHLGD